MPMFQQNFKKWSKRAILRIFEILRTCHGPKKYFSGKIHKTSGDILLRKASRILSGCCLSLSVSVGTSYFHCIFYFRLGFNWDRVYEFCLLSLVCQSLLVPVCSLCWGAFSVPCLGYQFFKFLNSIQLSHTSSVGFCHLPPAHQGCPVCSPRTC